MQSKFAAFAFGALVALLAVTTVAAVDPLRAGSPSVVNAASVTPGDPAADNAAAPVAAPIAAQLATQAPAAAPAVTATRAPSRAPSATPTTRTYSGQHHWSYPAATVSPRETHRQSGWSGWSGSDGRWDDCGW